MFARRCRPFQAADYCAAPSLRKSAFCALVVVEQHAPKWTYEQLGNDRNGRRPRQQGAKPLRTRCRRRGGVCELSSHPFRRHHTHTETPRALRGRGIASELVKGALELIRADGRKVIAGCGFVVDYLRKNPQFSDLTA